MKLRLWWNLGFAVLALLFPAQATAVKPDRQTFLNPEAVLPAGVACSAFALSVTVNVEKQTITTFFDNKGNPVRQLIVGRLIITLSIKGTGASLTTRLGDAFTIYFNPDGTLTFIGTGRSVVVFFPTDVPAGPSTTLYSGRVVFNIDPATGVSTLGDQAGTKVDVCAVLGG
jgi:hypothetical protein